MTKVRQRQEAETEVRDTEGIKRQEAQKGRSKKARHIGRNKTGQEAKREVR